MFSQVERARECELATGPPTQQPETEAIQEDEVFEYIGFKS